MLDEFINRGFYFGATLSNDVLAGARMEIESKLNKDSSEIDELVSESELKELTFTAFLMAEARTFASELAGRTVEHVSSQLATRRLGSRKICFHVDGQRTVETWNEMPFCQVIVGVPLTDVTHENSGNLFYLPGLHHEVNGFINKHIQCFLSADKRKGFHSLTELANRHEEGKEVVIWNAGQLFAMHALMPHGVQENHFADRSVWYFRFGIPVKRGAEGFKSAFSIESWPMMDD